MRPLFLDVDAQNDFVVPAGALYAPGAERVIPVIARLNRFAMSEGFHLISTACLHAENDPEFREWPPHCVAGTIGQLKPASTLAGQQIFEKQHTDVFRDARFLPMLRDLQATGYFVYGVVTEVCVRLAAEGLMRTGAPVTVVSDAVQAFGQAAADEFLIGFQERGGRVITSSNLV